MWRDFTLGNLQLQISFFLIWEYQPKTKLYVPDSLNFYRHYKTEAEATEMLSFKKLFMPIDVSNWI